MQLEATVADLQAQLGKLQDQLQWQEKNRKALEDLSKGQEQQSYHQIKALQKVTFVFRNTVAFPT